MLIKVYLNFYKFNLFVYFKQINTALPNDEGRRKQAGGTRKRIQLCSNFLFKYCHVRNT